MRGRVKWFSEEKGYGFITTDEGNDVFVHYSGIAQDGPGRRNLSDDQEVEFEVADGRKGPEAQGVRAV